MVGIWTLNPSILVRIQARQHESEQYDSTMLTTSHSVDKA